VAVVRVQVVLGGSCSKWPLFGWKLNGSSGPGGSCPGDCRSDSLDGSDLDVFDGKNHKTCWRK